MLLKLASLLLAASALQAQAFFSSSDGVTLLTDKDFDSRSE